MQAVLLHSGSSTFASTCDTLQCVDDVTVGAVIGMFNFTASFTSDLWMAIVYVSLLEMNLGYNLTDLSTMLNQAHVTRQQSRTTLKNQVQCTK